MKIYSGVVILSNDEFRSDSHIDTVVAQLQSGVISHIVKKDFRGSDHKRRYILLVIREFEDNMLGYVYSRPTKLIVSDEPFNKMILYIKLTFKPSNIIHLIDYS